jgi:hypothetical protein
LDETPKWDIHLVRDADIAVKACVAGVDILAGSLFDDTAQ